MAIDVYARASAGGNGILGIALMVDIGIAVAAETPGSIASLLIRIDDIRAICVDEKGLERFRVFLNRA